MIDKNHVKGVVCDVNKHRAAAMTDDGYTIFDIEEGEVQIGDTVLGDLHAHGSREVFNVTKDQALFIFIEAKKITHESAQYLLYHP